MRLIIILIVATHHSLSYPGKRAKVHSDENNGPPSITGRNSNGMTFSLFHGQTEVAALQQIQCSTLFTPYLVPDASTLSVSLHFIKKLLKTEQFVVIVPTAGRHHMITIVL